jgi:molybdopterin-containing oxidoreductase family iron-sulfur binding subunit
MTYNRCVGTRYCANNCPYKVRRFNWYNYNTDRSDEFIADVFPEVTELANLNAKWPTQLRWSPEVTVRARGVMEKCTFCVQRLRHHTKTKRKLGIAPKEEVQTACQQTCPAEAISFGNTVDEKSSVHAGYHSERAFQVLSHIGVKPAVRYLTRVRHGEADAHDDAHGAAAGHGEGQKAGDGHKAGEGQKAGHGGEGQKAAPAGQH